MIARGAGTQVAAIEHLPAALSILVGVDGWRRGFHRLQGMAAELCSIDAMLTEQVIERRARNAEQLCGTRQVPVRNSE